MDYDIASKELYLPVSPRLELPSTLSLASPSDTGIVIGYVLHPNSFIELDKYILPRDPLHVLILGTTGSGKSNTLRVLAQGFSSYSNNIVILLDWHGEHFIDNFIRIRPNEAKVPILGLEPKDIVQILNNIIYTIWGNELTPLMTRILYASIGASERTWNSLLESINNYIRKSKRDDIETSGLALYNRLFPIKDALKAMDVKGHKITSYISKGHGIIIDLSLLDIKSKIAYAQSLIAYLYNYLRLRRGIDKRVMIFIDEAHNMFPKHRLEIPLPIEEAFIEARKYGFRIILASAYPHKISQTVKFNSTTIIAHQHTNQVDSEDTAKNAGFIELRDPALY